MRVLLILPTANISSVVQKQFNRMLVSLFHFLCQLYSFYQCQTFVPQCKNSSTECWLACFIFYVSCTNFTNAKHLFCNVKIVQQNIHQLFSFFMLAVLILPTTNICSVLQQVVTQNAGQHFSFFMLPGITLRTVNICCK